MKVKKLKITALFLSLIFTISLCVFFSSATLMGDINKNGRIEASDARTVLRASVGLEKLSEKDFSLSDTDGDRKITASDARTVLRMSVGLEEIKELPDSEDKGYFEVHFIDVGQADCSLIISDGEALLIDGGNVEDGEAVISYLHAEGITELDYVISTHAHEDHVGGLSAVLDEFTVTKAVFAPEKGADTNCYKDFLTSVAAQELLITVPEAGDEIDIGGSSLTFITPLAEEAPGTNNSSLVTRIVYGENSFLFTGDAERAAEMLILESEADISADVLKVGHHGGETSTTYPFLREIMPQLAVISVGNNNTYGHPTEEVLSRLRDADVKVYRTDMQGHIVISSDGENITVTTERNQDAETNPTIPSSPEAPSTPNTPEPDIPDASGEYIGNINSKKLHLPTCSSLPKEENRIYFGTREAAINAGYEPCSRCKP